MIESDIPPPGGGHQGVGDVAFTPERQHAYMAGATVERLFPPQTTDAAYAVVSALNLLNAIVKLPWGPEVVTYSYIKGMAACTFLWLLKHPVEGVDIYWEQESQVTYFLIGHTQFSFHYVPLLEKYRHRYRHLPVQTWSGIHLQPKALSLFLPVSPFPADMEASPRLRWRLLHFTAFSLRFLLREMVHIPPPYAYQRKYRRPRIKENRSMAMSWQYLRHRSRGAEPLATLKTALSFHLWTTPQCELCRPHDNWHVVLMRYNGTNYRQVCRYLTRRSRPVKMRPESTLVRGHLYYIQRADRRWIALRPSRYLLLLAQYSFLKHQHHLYSLCITYRLACYLGKVFPRLRFINVLNYARMAVHHHLYTARSLLSVPPGSKARQLKVWIVVDASQQLRYFDVRSIPGDLLDEYAAMPDYTELYQLTHKQGKVGLFAYSRYQLLPPVYTAIHLHGNFAQVLRDDHKIAIYSISCERFVSGFIFDSIWYDGHRQAILGRTDGKVVVIHQFGVSRQSDRHWHQWKQTTLFCF